MKKLQVEIVTGTDCGIFEKRVNRVLSERDNIVSFEIRNGPPGWYNAIIYYLTEEGRTLENG